MQRIVIVGAGQAGLQIAEALRRDGYANELTLVGNETWLPYQRPPLSKKFLLGALQRERLYFRLAEYLQKIDVRIVLGDAAVALDRATQTVRLASGEALAYDGLALATGARVRRLTCRGADSPRVFYLRGIDDAEMLAAALGTAERVAVVGGGFIGLEVAAVARELGRTVTVIEAQERLMPRVVAPLLSEFYRAEHTARGVVVRTGLQVEAIDTGPRDARLRFGGGATLCADAIVVGIGVVPNAELAEAAGLACDGGIVVDEFARTADPAVVAAGDCTLHRNLLFASPHRVESVQNAMDQAKVAAASLLGRSEAYAQVPWFWSDQYDLKLQMAGLSRGHESYVVRGAPESRAFSVFYYREERLLGVDSVNRPADHMLARKLLAGGVAVSAEQAANPDFELKQLLPD